MGLSDKELARLIKSGESELLEFKREWYDLSRAEGKASLAKVILALANTVRPDTTAFLLLGVEDERQGARFLGVAEPPDAETVSNVLSQYILPPVDAHCRHYEHLGKVISVVTVSLSPARPHHSVHEHAGILSTNVVYVRRDRTTGTATLPEIEAMIREKDARLGPVVSAEALQAGIVQKSDSGGTGVICARVTNLTTEPVGGVDVTFDVRSSRNPELFERVRCLGGAVLPPGESREVELRLSNCIFYVSRFEGATGQREWHRVELGVSCGRPLVRRDLARVLPRPRRIHSASRGASDGRWVIRSLPPCLCCRREARVSVCAWGVRSHWWTIARA